MFWRDVKKGHKFEDSSYVTQIKETEVVDCFRFWVSDHPKSIKDNSITVSSNHYFLCETDRLSKDTLNLLRDSQDTEIPEIEGKREIKVLKS